MDIADKAKILYEEIGSIIGYQGRLTLLGLIDEVERLTKERDELKKKVVELELRVRGWADDDTDYTEGHECGKD